MRVFEIRADVTHYQVVQLVYDNDIELIKQAKKGPTTAIWRPVPVEISSVDKLPGDCPYLTAGIPVFSKRALHALLPLIKDEIEVLPLDCPSGEYFIASVLNILDCLDISRSEIERFEATGNIKRIINHVFDPKCIGEHHIFRIPERRLSQVFVTDRFKEVVEEHQLSGMRFEERWEG